MQRSGSTVERKTQKRIRGGRERDREERRDFRGTTGIIPDSEEKSIFEQIQAIAARDARKQKGDKYIRLYLISWWCEYYNRPMKDPILQEYTTEELAYEYYMISERRAARQEYIQEIDDKMEEEKIQADLDWADAEEAKEMAELAKADNKQADPTKDPDNIKWMEEQIEKNKLVFGDDFGEDLSLDFDGDD